MGRDAPAIMSRGNSMKEGFGNSRCRTHASVAMRTGRETDNQSGKHLWLAGGWGQQTDSATVGTSA